MAERDRGSFSAGNDLDARAHTDHLRHSRGGASSTSRSSTATTTPLPEDAQQVATPPASGAELAADQQRTGGLRPRETPGRDSSARRGAGSSRKMHGATATPSAPAQETEGGGSTGASPPSRVQETVNVRAGRLVSSVATPRLRSLELGIAADAGSSTEIPAAAAAAAAAMAHPAEHGSEHEDDREDDRDRDERGSEESANQCFEYGGEREEHAEASKKPERDEQGKQGGQAAGEDVAHTDTNKDDGDEETTRSVPLDSSSSQCVAQDAAPEFSTPSGRVAQLSAESPRAENVQDARAAAAAPSQQQHGPEAKEDGERHERIQVPAAGSNTETTSSRTVGSSDIVPLSVTVPRLAATGTPNVEAGIQLAPGYIRRPSYMPGPAMRPARSAARASIQLSLPPLTVLGLEAESTCAASNDNAIRIAQAAAEAEPEEPGTAEGQSWAEYHSLNAGRQHSTSNLVAVRRNLRQLSVELFEEGDSDDSSSSSRSSGASDEEDASVDEPSNEVDNHVSWQLSEEGKSRMAQLTKATVAKESPAVKMSRKYLKLFAPSNSAHDTYKVLATVHRRMNGTGWPRRGGWDSYLVRRSRVELDLGRVYGIRSKEGSVELVTLSSNNVCGRIPPTIARLESLKGINLSENHLSGPIPMELGSLLQLQTLQLHGNNLRDNIPPLLGSLISLTQLSLGHNKLSGPLPDSLGNLIHLKYFSAEHNRLSGPVPSFVCHMTALENFNISNNELRGAIPDKIGALVRLRKLDFAHNQFSGDIPASLGNLSALNWLFLDHNQLTGPVPANFGNLKELLILNLSFNRLSGPLPAALPLLINLTSASLQGNLFVGPFHFPATFQFWFSRVSGMAALDFGSNEIEEPFPDMHGMHELRILLLNNNRIYDRLAEGLAEACPNLFKLCLHNNRLSGEIPHNIGALTRLEVLDLSDNCFDGSLPPSMASLQLLDTFSASNNELSGELPSFLGSLTLLTSLALNGNQFTGSMPRELGQLTLLKRLYLEKNELVGSIPKELSTCTSLEELYLHDNRLWGKIPDSLRALRGLRYLYLYRNKLTGVVPEWMGELFRLRGLILGENRLRGHIPWQLGHLHKLQDLYLNDNNLDGSIPERMVVNCECLQRLYLGGNRLTGTVPRYLRHVRDLRELNIEGNNLHGEMPIPLFLKTSFGPNACGLKWEGNPRIVDSRHNFTSVLACAQRAGPEKKAPVSEPQDRPPRHAGRHSVSAYEPISFTLLVPNRRPSYSSRPPVSHGYNEMSTGISLGPDRARGDRGPANSKRGDNHSEEFVRNSGIRAMEEGSGESGDDSGSVVRPWANGEDVSYFLLKVIAGNALVLIDFVIAVRLYAIGCTWGCVLVMLWKAWAGFEGILATRRLGYGCSCLPMAALGLALAWQTKICYHHSCESDLFQVLQQVEWHWHAMIQLATQLAAALSWWGREQVGRWYLLASAGLKALVVGIVSMQRLDDQHLTRYRERRSGSPKLGSAPSVLRDRFLPWLRDSAWPRLILVGFHIAEVCERTIPLASLTAALGDRAFFAPLALTPGMLARYVARRARTSRSRGDTGGVAAAVRSALKLSLDLDSAFGAGTRGHVLATISTTLEAVVFEAIASKAPREYPDSLHHGLFYSIFALLVFTWAVVVLELVIPVGREHERDREPPPPPPPPRSPRLLLLGSFAPSKPFRRSGSGSRKTPTTIHVQPLASTLEMLSTDNGSGNSESERREGGLQRPGGRGGKGSAVVVPIEG